MLSHHRLQTLSVAAVGPLRLWGAPAQGHRLLLGPHVTARGQRCRFGVASLLMQDAQRQLGTHTHTHTHTPPHTPPTGLVTLPVVGFKEMTSFGKLSLYFG